MLSHIPAFQIKLHVPVIAANGDVKKEDLDPRQIVTADFPPSNYPHPDIIITTPTLQQGSNDSVSPSRSLPEFVVYADPTECPRTAAVEAFWDRIQKVAIVHVRGTPASGKSTLARLLRDYVRRTQSDIPVYHCSWDPLRGPDTDFYYHALNRTFGENGNDLYWGMRRYLLIIDEAQLAYSYTPIWNDLIKSTVPGRGPLIVLFSSYGSPPNWLLEVRTPTPFVYPSRQRVSLRPSKDNPNVGLFLSRAEFDDAIFRVCKYYSRDELTFKLSDAKDYIWELTNGQPAAVRAVLDGLSSSEICRPFRKYHKTIPLDVALKFLENDSVLVETLESSIHGIARSLPSSEVLRDVKVTEFLRGMVACRVSRDDPKTNNALNTCYTNGWLHAELTPDERVVYVYPTTLHRRIMEHKLSLNITPFPLKRFLTVMDLVVSALRNFKPAALQKVNAGVFETRYQDEVYRGCYEVLGRQLYLCN